VNANTNYKTEILEARTLLAFWKKALEDGSVVCTKVAFSNLGEYNKARVNLNRVEQDCAYFRGIDYLATV